MIKSTKNILLFIPLFLFAFILLVPLNVDAVDMQYDLWDQEATTNVEIDVTEIFDPYAVATTIKQVNVSSNPNGLVIAQRVGNDSSKLIELDFSSDASNGLQEGVVILLEVVYDETIGATTTEVTKIVELTIRSVLTPEIAFSLNSVTKNLSEADFMIEATYNGAKVTGIQDYSTSNPAVAKVDTNGKIEIVGVGTATIYLRIPASIDGKYTIGTTALDLTVVNGYGNIITGEKDFVISFTNTWDIFDKLEVNDIEVTVNADKTINGYNGYSENIGEYVDGSMNITFYKEFLQHLQNEGIFDLKVDYLDRSDAVMPPEVTTISSVIRELETYTVSFNANGGSGKMESLVLNELPGMVGIDFELIESKFTAPEGMQFSKWAIVNPQIPEEYLSYHEIGSIYNVMYNVEFVAIWEPISENPKTGDNIMFYVITLAGAMITLTTINFIKKKQLANN